VVFGPEERGWCEVGLGQSERGRGGGVHGPKQRRKEREERKKKRGGGFPSCLSAKTQERKERKEKGAGVKKRETMPRTCAQV
jgi:hypothetical protein